MLRQRLWNVTLSAGKPRKPHGASAKTPAGRLECKNVLGGTCYTGVHAAQAAGTNGMVHDSLSKLASQR